MGKLSMNVGGMFSGKSTELIRKYQRNRYAKIKALLFNHKLDTRYGENVVSTHLQNQEKSISIQDEKDLLEYLNRKENEHIKKIYIDEFQFFSVDFAMTVIDLVEKQNYDVTIAGLDLTFDNKPFESISALMPYADEIFKLKAVCHICGGDASKSFRLTDSNSEVEVGSNGKYIALCRDCYRQMKKK